MSASHFIPVHDDLYHELTQRACRQGVSAEEWATSVLAEHARAERLSDEYFDRRATGASHGRLGDLLSKAPERAPDAGDELES